MLTYTVKNKNLVGVHYYWENIKVIVQPRVNHQHHMSLFISEIIYVDYHNFGTKRLFHYWVVVICISSFLPAHLHIAFVTGSDKFFDLYIKSASGKYIHSFP